MGRLNARSWDERQAILQETEYIALRRADLIMLKKGPFRMQGLQ